MGTTRFACLKGHATPNFTSDDVLLARCGGPKELAAAGSPFTVQVPIFHRLQMCGNCLSGFASALAVSAGGFRRTFTESGQHTCLFCTDCFHYGATMAKIGSEDVHFGTGHFL
jgi:hypothetical protein